jgi:hypothetical protein
VSLRDPAAPTFGCLNNLLDAANQCRASAKIDGCWRRASLPEPEENLLADGSIAKREPAAKEIAVLRAGQIKAIYILPGMSAIVPILHDAKTDKLLIPCVLDEFVLQNWPSLSLVLRAQFRILEIRSTAISLACPAGKPGQVKGLYTLFNI